MRSKNAEHPQCPHCGGEDTELQIKSQTREIYCCNGCAKTFDIKDYRYQEAKERL